MTSALFADPKPLAYTGLAGPSGYPLLGNAHQIRAQVFHQQLEDWARQYGRRYRLRITHRRFIVITDPEAIASVLRRRPGTFRKGPRLVQVARDLGFPGVFTANDDAWQRQRQLVMPGLDPAHLRTYLPAMVAVTLRLRRLWQSKAEAGEEIDLLHDLMRYTVDVTTALAFGHDLNTIEQGDDVAIQRHLNVIFPALFKRNLAPVDLQHWVKDRKVHAHVSALREAVHRFIEIAREQIAHRPQLRDKPENLIQSLVATRDAGMDLSDQDLAGNVLTLLLAGEDTTANTLAWLIWLLGAHPDERARARAEVDVVVGAGRVLDRIEQLAELDWIDACANEAMRLKPVAPINILQASEETDVDGVTIPKGTFVICLMRPAGMEPSRFRDPQAFRPSRWLEQGHESAAAGRMFGAKRVVMPFGAGPRICPGRYLALAEIKMVTAMLLANFSLDAVYSDGGEPPERLNLTMAPVGLKMRLRRRR